MSRCRCVLAIALLLLATGRALAQDATVVGTVVDESKAVLPGVTVTATQPATGRQFVSVTNERGEYRLVALLPGQYTIQAELAGFAPTVLRDLELLVGQNATIAFTLKVAALNESVTVTGESPLVDTRQSQVAGNVDRRQMEELPIQGRNWMQLSALVKGVTANSITTTPGAGQGRFQLNLDGQEITQGLSVAGFGQPGLSRDAIAEYQVVTNLFDVSQGRSAQMQVHAITRSGTNNVGGSLYGYFRDDRFNSADLFANRVLPYSNQQVGGTLGGPVVHDKLQYFTSYEYEREPNTAVLAPAALGGQRLSIPTKSSVNNALGRADYQMATNDHLVVRGAYFRRFEPVSIGNAYPTQGSTRVFDSNFVLGNWSHVISNAMQQELKVGYYHYRWKFTPMEGVPITPTYTFPGLSVGPPWNYPDGEELQQDRITARYDLNWHRTSHDFKLGGEYVRAADTGWWMARSRGEFVFSALPADAGRRFPIDAWTNPASWDLTGLDASVQRYDRYYAELGGQNKDHGNWSFDIPRPTYAIWFGDTWTLGKRLTLNFGLRYDLAWGDLSPPMVNDTEVIVNNGRFTEDVGFKSGIRDTNNLSPRAGFAWNVMGDSNLVIRGGTGIFSTLTGSSHVIDQHLCNGQRVIVNSYPNDGRPGFLQDPTRGVTPEDVLSGRVPLAPQNITVMSPEFEMPYTWQSILGFQKQLTDVMGFDSDLIYWRGYNEETQRDANLFFDPVSGNTRNPRTAGRPNPSYGPIYFNESRGRSDYLALANSFTRRYRNNFQVGATYTLMFFRHESTTRFGGYGGARMLNPYDVEQDWGRSAEFQRHTLRLNGLAALPFGFRLSGFYQFGSGNYFQVNSGVDPLGTGSTRVRSNLTIVPRNTFKGDKVQAFDMRISKEIKVVGNVRLTGLAEVFNAFNYASFSRNTLEPSPNFGTPTGARTPRTWQLGFRMAF
jgi:hypothetical protein